MGGGYRGRGSSYRGGYNNNSNVGSGGRGGYNRFNSTGRGGGIKPAGTFSNYNNAGGNNNNNKYNQIELKPIDFSTYKPPEVKKLTYTPNQAQLSRNPEEIKNYRCVN